jgi:hypothetical protein
MHDGVCIEVDSCVKWNGGWLPLRVCSKRNRRLGTSSVSRASVGSAQVPTTALPLFNARFATKNSNNGKKTNKNNNHKMCECGESVDLCVCVFVSERR